jgi:hypothetical protein
VEADHPFPKNYALSVCGRNSKISVSFASEKSMFALTNSVTP